MNHRSVFRLIAGAAIAIGGCAIISAITACEKKGTPSAATTPTPAPTASGKKSILIGVIAKSNNNPVFQAAHTGALDAAAKLSKDLGIEVKVDIRTPIAEDAQKQAQAIEQLVALGADGIALSCTDGETLKKSIDDAVDKGVTLVTFDSDSPASKRMAYYGIDDVAAGKAVMRELAKAMGEKGGVVAILSGTQTAPNLNARIRGVKEELETLKGKGFTLKETFYLTKETPQDGVALLQQAMNAHPDIAGWAMVGGWPLFTQNALDGIADKAKVVSVDTLPEELAYVEKGEVQALIGQDCYGWGYESVVMLVDKIHGGKAPASAVRHFELAIVTKSNVTEYKGQWEKWLQKK